MDPILYPFLLVAGLVLVVFAILALSRNRGAGETRPAGAVRISLGRLSVLDQDALSELVRELFVARGYRIVVQEPEGDLIVEQSDGLVSQRIYVRVIPRAELALVSSDEVLGTIERARAEGGNKVVVITPGTFSNESRTAALGTGADLLDGPRFGELVAMHLPRRAAELEIRRAVQGLRSPLSPSPLPQGEG